MERGWPLRRRKQSCRMRFRRWRLLRRQDRSLQGDHELEEALLPIRGVVSWLPSVHRSRKRRLREGFARDLQGSMPEVGGMASRHDTTTEARIAVGVTADVGNQNNETS